MRSSEPGEEMPRSWSKTVGLGAGHQPGGVSVVPSRAWPSNTLRVRPDWVVVDCHGSGASTTNNVRYNTLPTAGVRDRV